MEQIRKWLRRYGLNETATEVYLAILKHPESRTADIQRQTGFVRTTIYYSLAELVNQGLVSENQQNNIKTYRAAHIENLEGAIESRISEQERTLEALSDLKPIFEKLQTKPAESDSYVSRYQGIEPVKQAIEAALRCKSKRWHIIAARDNFLYHTSKQYKQYYLQERKRRGITARTLWEPVDSFKDPSLEDLIYRNPRRLPDQFKGTFKSLVILYDDTTLIIDPYEQKTAHAIHNATSSHLLRMLFEYIWDSVGSNS